MPILASGRAIAVSSPSVMTLLNLPADTLLAVNTVALQSCGDLGVKGSAVLGSSSLTRAHHLSCGLFRTP